MKKSLIALAALGAVAGAAHAQSSSVTFYGTFDLGIINATAGVGSGAGVTAARQTAMSNSTMSSSIWGLRGLESLGGNLAAGFDLESDFDGRTGVSGGANTVTTFPGGNVLFNRKADVFIQGDFGKLMLGKHLGALFVANAGLDVKGVNSSSNVNLWTNTHGFGNVAPSLNANGGTLPSYGALAAGPAYVTTNGGYYASDVFISNAIQYTSPTFNGFNLQAEYQLGGTAGNATANGAYEGVINYAGGALKAAGGVRLENDANGDKWRTTYVLGAKYAIGQATIGLTYDRTTITKTTLFNSVYGSSWNGTQLEWDAYNLTGGYQITPSLFGALTFQYFHNRDTSANSKLYSAYLNYALSKRTSLYLQGSTVSQGGTNAIGTIFGAQGSGSPQVGPIGNNNNSIVTGIVHKF